MSEVIVTLMLEIKIDKEAYKAICKEKKGLVKYLDEIKTDIETRMQNCIVKKIGF